MAAPMPKVVGIESDSAHAAAAAARFRGIHRVQIRRADFLHPAPERFDYIVGNPPYVPITELTVEERETYRKTYATAKGRFDLYILFFEQALALLKPHGRLVFITPEKFLYVETAAPLRRLLREMQVDEVHFLHEGTFEGLTTYPLITTITGTGRSRPTRVIHRDGRTTLAQLDDPKASWLPAIRGAELDTGSLTLADLCVRISCGVATGADSVFVVGDTALDARLRAFARPTISGRQMALGRALEPLQSMLIPYTERGDLLAEPDLGDLGSYLSDPKRRARLLARTCVARKPWYAFHESPPMTEFLRPKVLCKDICASPFFVPDPTGNLVPRHSVYYIVPKDPTCLEALTDHLNSSSVQQWLYSHCQRAANGFLRLQSHVLKRVPLPPSFKNFDHSTNEQPPQLEVQFA